MELEISKKALAINLAMNIELGEVAMIDLLDEIRKSKKSIAKWLPILKFWEEESELGKSTINRLYLESRLLRS